MTSQTIPHSIFRAYDIRGKYLETLTPEITYLIGKALGSETLASGESSLITGRDGRYSSPDLMKALQHGILATGCNVIDVGEVPTPVLYFATKVLSSKSGVMLTGSHNPADYNGMKIVINGKTLAEENIQKLYQRLSENNFIEGEGSYTSTHILPDYLQKILDNVQLGKKLKVVVDCGNGVAAHVAPKLFREMGCEVIELFCDIDGYFPNHDPDPSQPENLTALIDAVAANKADLGIIFDGDADRLGVISNHGEVIWPDQQMILFSKQVLQRQPNATIIFDVKCSQNLATAIENMGGKPLMWKTGHSLIKAKMQQEKAAFAGEMSGHFFFQDKWFGFDDGIYAGARFLEIVSQDERTVEEIFATLPQSYATPELRVAMADEVKFSFMTTLMEKAEFPDARINTIDGLRIEYPYGWGLIRASNTSPYLIVRFEAESEEGLQKIKNEFTSFLLSIDKTLVLPF